MYLYMFVYNITLINLFWIFFSVTITNLKTLYSLSLFSFNSFYLFTITVSLFSLAGVPPFLGFFSKLFVLNILVNKNFYLFYYIFFIILLLGLYFYVQNIRFLHSTNHKSLAPLTLNGSRRITFFIYYYLVFTLFFLINSVFYLDDFIFLFLWIFS